MKGVDFRLWNEGKKVLGMGGLNEGRALKSCDEGDLRWDAGPGMVRSDSRYALQRASKDGNGSEAGRARPRIDLYGDKID